MIVFPFETKDAGAVRRAVDKYEDRSAAIVVGSLLEDQLFKMIKSRFRQTDAPLEGRMFKGSGPIGSFSAKLDLGFLLGLYSLDAHKQLHRVREIRNKFAHLIKPLDFETYDIADMINNLPTGKQVSAYWTSLINIIAANPQFVKGSPPSNTLIQDFRDMATYFGQMDNSNRDRYIIYTESWTFLFLMMIMDQESSMLSANVNLLHP